MLSNKVTVLRTNLGEVVRRGSPVTVVLKPWDIEIPFKVGFFDCRGEAGALTHLHIDVASGPDGGRKDMEFWKRVLVHYQGAVRLTLRDKQLPTHEEPWVRRSEILGLIAVAFPQRYSAGEFGSISGKTVADAARIDPVDRPASRNGASVPLYAIGHTPLAMQAHVSGNDVVRVALATLMPIMIKDRTVLAHYYAFEAKLFDKYAELHARYQDQADATALLMDGMYEHLESIRKKADDPTRLDLRFLKASCDTVMMDMYQYVAAGVIQNKDILRQLNGVSINYNHLAHSVQDRLGGIVPALHPIWMLCLNSRAFVDALIKYASNPAPASASGHLDMVLSDAILKYARLLELQDSLEDETCSLDEPCGPTGEASSDVLSTVADTTVIAPGGDARRTSEFLNLLIQQEGKHPDVAVAVDMLLEEMSTEECARKYACSKGEVSKRKKRGLGRLRKLLESNGITHECLDVLAARHIAQAATPGSYPQLLPDTGGPKKR